MASLSLFYRYYFVHCSDELAACIPPPKARPRSTRQASFAHNYCVELSNVRINRFSDGFFPFTSCLWNSLLYFWLPLTFLPSKGRSTTTLRTKWHDFFLLPFLDILYKFVLFFFTAFLFLFLGMQTQERAHCARSVFPFIKKKEKENCVCFKRSFIILFIHSILNLTICSIPRESPEIL